MAFSIKGDSFFSDNKKVFLNSGEIHYFRIKKELWTKHLEAAKEAGINTISTYVPWAWHESEEGVFDFDGSSAPERDILGWLRKCQDLGLTCIVKPGPFILAEFRGAGLPDWFMDKYYDVVKMRNRNGQIFPSDGVSLFNKIYLEKVSLWYDNIMPLISKHEVSAGGPIIMMQICNEIGVFSWLAKQGDYKIPVKEHFITYLTKKFSGIAEVNNLWETNYTSYTDIELPPDGKLPYQSKGDRGRDYEWHCFWRTYYGDYLRMLSEMARKKGVTVPLYHNLPGWIYGNGYEFPVNITMYEDLFHEKSEILFGIDHIPEFLSHRNLHDDRIINDITFAMQGNKPLFAAEFQSGSREYHVVTNPREMGLFYKASIANGLVGWNYYMFSQGRNPRHKGYSGETFYWFNPLTAEGERTSAFPLVKRMNELLKTSENLIVEAKRKAEICVLFYPPYYATELERPVSAECELTFSYSAIRRSAYFDGLLKALQVLNIDYDMLDLSKASSQELGKFKQVWAFCTDEMNAPDQQSIVDYTKAGGNAVIFPYLPDREMSNKPCTIIRDALNISPSGKEIIDSPLIDIYEQKDIKCANPLIIYSPESLANAQVIARTLNGSICGFSKPLGKGSVIHVGTWVGFDTEGHKPVYESILRQSGAKLRQANSDNEFIVVRERFTNSNSAILFVGNYYNEEHTGTVSYTHPGSGEEITIPYMKGEILWPSQYAVLTPVCMEIQKGIKILHSTSDILKVADSGGSMEITLYGDRDLQGEIVFEGTNLNSIKSAKIDSVDVPLKTDGKRIIISYHHKHKINLTLNLIINAE
jgi:beta-galactosidase